MPVTAACIDITALNRPMDVAYLQRDALHLRNEPNLESFLEWVDDQQPENIAVDAPSKQNIGLVPGHREFYGIPEDRYENFRIAEVLLRMKNIGLYNTPQENPPMWMEVGWDLYAQLGNMNYNLWDTPGVPTLAPNMMLEVHPHASVVVGLGWIPQRKQTLAGQLERAAYLRRECHELDIAVEGTLLAVDQLAQLQGVVTTWDTIVADGINLPLLSHDQLDAIAGLTTVVRAVRGDAFAVGHQDDGVIVVPQELADLAYERLHN